MDSKRTVVAAVVAGILVAAVPAIGWERAGSRKEEVDQLGPGARENPLLATVH